MPRVSQEQARLNRQRVVEVAAALFRERGLNGVGVADIMAAAGLTHGGFYGQFANKDALAVEAFDAALSEDRRGDVDTILANYLAADEDRRALREGVRMAREVVAQTALDPYRDAEYAPGADVRSDADIDAWIRAKSETIYHPVGTCRMGAAGDPLAVVDDQLRLQGIEGLRVVDASVMPTLVGGNTNAPTIMVAERAADLILGKAALPPMDVPVFEDGRAVAA